MVEQTHRRLKDALRARCSGLNWADHLPWVLLGLRTAPREDTGLSPAQAVLGCNLALPTDHPDAQNPERPLQEELATLRTIREAASGPEARHNTAAHQQAPETIPDALRTADRVLVRRNGHMPLLSQLYNGPYAVLRHAPRFFTIQMGERDEIVHMQRLNRSPPPPSRLRSHPIAAALLHPPLHLLRTRHQGV